MLPTKGALASLMAQKRVVGALNKNSENKIRLEVII